MHVATKPVVIASVVEGHGEVKALPKLLYRLAAVATPGNPPRIPPPHRIPKSKLVKVGKLDEAVEAAGNQVHGSGGILVLIDADDECPAQLGPDPLERARTARSDKIDLVIVDDIGMLPISPDASEGLYRLVDAAYERRSIALSSILHPSAFDQLMEKNLATALVDRLLHHAHVVLTDGESVRLGDATAGRGVVPLGS